MAGLAFKISPENFIGDFGYVESWSQGDSVAPDGWAMTGTAGSVAKESTIKKFGEFAMKITSGASSVYAAEYKYDITTRRIQVGNRKVLTSVYLAGRTIKFGMWIRCDTASKARIYINDGVARSNSSYHDGDDTFQFIEVEHQVDDNFTDMIFGAEVENNGVVAYFDGGIVVEGENIFTEFRGDNVYIREEDWRPSVTFSVTNFTILRRDASRIDDVKMRNRTIRLSLQIHSDDFTTARGIFDSIVKACVNGRKELLFEDDRISVVQLTNVPTLQYIASGKVFLFNLQFTSEKPFKRYIGMKRISTVVDSSPEEFQVEVAGNMNSFPIVYFLPSGATITSLSLENRTNNEFFSYSDNVADGGTLKLNMETIEILNDGVDGQSYVSGDWMSLKPGTNYMKYAGSTFHTLNIDYFDQYL